MNEYAVGDLVEAVKGEWIARSRLVRSLYTTNTGEIGLMLDGIMSIPFPNSDSAGRNGWVFTVIEKAAPKLPTDPGAVIAWDAGHYMGLAILEKPNQWLFNDRNFTSAEMTKKIDGADVTRIESVPVTAKKVLDAVRAQTTMHCNGCADHLATIAKDFGVEA